MRFRELEIGKVYENEDNQRVLVCGKSSREIFINCLAGVGFMFESSTYDFSEWELSEDQSHDIQLFDFQPGRKKSQGEKEYSEKKLREAIVSHIAKFNCFVADEFKWYTKDQEEDSFEEQDPCSPFLPDNQTTKQGTSEVEHHPRPGTYMLRDNTGWVTVDNLSTTKSFCVVSDAYDRSLLTDNKGTPLSPFWAAKAELIDFSRPCLPVRVGQKWKDGNNDIISIKSIQFSAPWPIVGDRATFQLNGINQYSKIPWKYDLAQLISEPEEKQYTMFEDEQRGWDKAKEERLQEAYALRCRETETKRNDFGRRAWSEDKPKEDAFDITKRMIEGGPSD